MKIKFTEKGTVWFKYYTIISISNYVRFVSRLYLLDSAYLQYYQAKSWQIDAG